MATVAIPRSAQYEANDSRCHGDDTPCVICGKAIKDQSTAKSLHVGYGGTYAMTEDDTGVGDDGDMDFFPVGPECARKHPELRSFLR